MVYGEEKSPSVRWLTDESVRTCQSDADALGLSWSEADPCVIGSNQEHA